MISLYPAKPLQVNSCHCQSQKPVNHCNVIGFKANVKDTDLALIKLRTSLKKKLNSLPPLITNLDKIFNSGKTCIMFGTFNPLHITHVQLGENAIKQYHYDNVVFTPLNLPAHKKNRWDIQTLKERINLMRLQIGDNKKLLIFDTSSVKKDTSEPEEIMQEIAPRHYATNKTITSIVGSDALTTLSKESLNFILKSLFLQAEVPGYGFVRAIEIDGQNIVLNTMRLNTAEIVTSSTEVRSMLANGISTKNYLSKDASDYIKAYGLYIKPKPKIDIIA